MNKLFQHLLHLANSANYPQKNELFYPLKKRLLEAHAKPDGWDLQTIDKLCWRCDGTGNDDWGEDDTCGSCDGSGIYATHVHYLLRFKLGDRTYHTPVHDRPEGEPSDKIQGLVKHARKPSARTGLISSLLLVLRYDSKLFWRLATSRYTRTEFGWEYRESAWKRFWYRQHTSMFNCPRSIVPIVAVMLLFAGWMPIGFKSFGVYGLRVAIPRRNWTDSLIHLRWVLRAWMPEAGEFDDVPF